MSAVPLSRLSLIVAGERRSQLANAPQRQALREVLRYGELSTGEVHAAYQRHYLPHGVRRISTVEGLRWQLRALVAEGAVSKRRVSRGRGGMTTLWRLSDPSERRPMPLNDDPEEEWDFEGEPE